MTMEHTLIDSFRRDLGRPGLNASSAVLALAVKFLLAFLMLSAFNGFQYGPRFKIFESGDTMGYLQPAKNLISHGTWRVALNNPTSVAVRPPAYGLIYLPILAATSERTADFLMLALQLGAAAFASLCFAESVRLIGGSERIVWASLIFYLGSFQLLCYDIRLLTESLTVSISVCTQYLVLRYRLHDTATSLIVGGLLCIAIFLRPFLGIFIPILLLALAMRFKRDIRGLCAKTAELIAPLGLAFSLWSAWSSPRVGNFIFFQNSLGNYGNLSGSPQSYRAYSDFLKAWGGDNVPWNPQSAAGWFEGSPTSRDYRFPKVIFNPPRFTQATLDSAKMLISQSGLHRHSTSYIAVERELDAFAADFSARRPLYSMIIAPTIVFFRTIPFIQTDGIHNSNFYMRSGRFRQLIDLFAVLLNLFLLLGLTASWLIPQENMDTLKHIHRSVVAFFLANSAFFAVILRSSEGRFSLIPLWLVYPWSFLALQSLIFRLKSTAPRRNDV